MVLRLTHFARATPGGLAAGLQEAWSLLLLRGAASSAAADPPSTSASPAAAAAAAGAVAEDSSSTSPERVGKVAAHSFRKAPKATAAALLRGLSELDRVHLVLELQKTTNRSLLAQKEAYVDDLVKQVLLKPNSQHAKLTREQIHSAVVYQRMLQRFAAVSEEPPTVRQLAAVAFASGLPFVAFGILDNGIMLVAGEQIDHAFGARLGLTTLASAALGNLVADVVGVSATQSVQENIKRFGVAKPPRLSLLQQNMRSVRVANFLGAGLGVALGCLIGMLPLLVMDPGFFVSSSPAAAAGGGIGAAAEAMAAAAAGSGAMEAAPGAVAEVAAAAAAERGAGT